ncbi:MAG TPA: thiamine diphosphokinase [Firmicutes bacterium]|jgi:thiamine pyrophosphokinase|nr:thiamine diphosphokinase [Bacillota bacterium]
MRCLILLAGDLNTAAWQSIPELTGDFRPIICADGGGLHALRLCVTPDIVLGDFDSLPAAELHLLQAVRMHKFPTLKDETDAELAVAEALRSGATEVVLAGALGGRLDHTLANLGLLRVLRRHGVKAVATDGNQSVWLVTPHNSPFVVNAQPGALFSVLPLSTQADDVSITGARWELTHSDLEQGATRTVSNQLLDTPAMISVGQGELLVLVNYVYK